MFGVCFRSIRVTLRKTEAVSHVRLDVHHVVYADVVGMRLQVLVHSLAYGRNTNLTDIELDNAELPRCNFRVCVITARRLHKILNCRDPEV